MNSDRKFKIQIAAIVVAFVCVCFGFWRGEATLIFNQATNICMECVGLG